MSHDSIIRICASAIVLLAAATDVRSKRIPNWLTLAGVCTGLILNVVTDGLAGLQSSLAGMALGFAAYFILYCLRAMGAGDVKLMAAVGAIIGPAAWLSVFIATSIAGGLLALGLMLWKRRTRETLWNTFFLVQELAHFRAPWKQQPALDVKHPRSLNLPHGVAIAAGTLACLFLPFAGPRP